jgi:hypothetical protein
LLYGTVERHVPTEVLGCFSADVEPSWIEWLESETERATGRVPNLVTEALVTLRDRFAGIRLFHATRLDSLQSIADHGLIARDAQALLHWAREIFANVDDAKALDAAIARARPEDRAGLVYTFSALSIALDIHDSYKPKGCIPEFAVQGGEWLRAVAINLGTALKTDLGKGYLFEISIPWHRCSGDTQRMIAQHALNASLITTRLDRTHFRMAGGFDCVAISGNIPSTAIVAFCETDQLRGQLITAADLHWTPWGPRTHAHVAQA